MLDEAEFAIVWALYDGAIRTGKATPRALGPTNIADLFRPVCDAYERLTGFREDHAAAILHHRLSLYGPPCGACGKPLRTPKARHCAACGAPR